MRKKFTDYMQSIHINQYKIIPFDKCKIINESKLRRYFPDIEPKSVMIFIVPYYSGDYPERNVSLYAVAEDYHIFFDNIYTDLLHNNTDFIFKGFADNSPIDEVHAAAIAGLGVIGDNGLLINERYGSFVFIGEIITDYEFDYYDEIRTIQFCNHCGKCAKSCPSKDECLSAITQKHGNLTEHETNLIQSHDIAWGCDICQLCCPHNRDIPITEIDFFHNNLRSVVDQHSDITNRAYAWRGEKVINRNLTILNQRKENMNILNQMIESVKNAGKIMLSAKDNENMIHSKSGTANFVTDYDLMVQEYLYNSLKNILPEANFIGEESDFDTTIDIDNGDIFIIDPIDGTTNFIHDYGHSCISIALLRNGEPFIGIVYNPYRDELFHAVKSNGAYLNNAPIKASERRLRDGLICFGSSPYYRDLADKTFDTLKLLYLNSRDIRRSGSAALDLCYVACGRCDLFYELILSPWDYAAGLVIINESGGIITAMDGNPITFDKPSSVLAGNRFAYNDFNELTKKRM